MRRMVRSGKLPAHIEQIAPWGPTWVVNEADIVRLLHPDQPLVEVLLPDYDAPMQMLRDVREGLVTLHTVIREGDQGLRDEIRDGDQTLRDELAALRAEVERLRHELTTPKHRWWPWSR